MFGSTRHGWIGIDVGASTLTLAQLGRHRGRVELLAAASVQRARSDNPADALRDDLETALAVAGDLRGKRVAAMVSMASCQLGPGRMPIGQAGEASEACVGTWPTGIETSDPDKGWYTLAADVEVVRTIADELLSAGLSCRTVDGAPMAIARAVGMVASTESSSKKRATGGIDWGWSSAMFCSVISGYPVYVRKLKNCGLADAALALTKEVNITFEDARDALTRHLPLAPGAPSADDPVCAELGQLLRPYFDRFKAEVQRTIDHLRIHRQQANPAALRLLGGGAMMSHVADWLASSIQLPTRIWQPPGIDNQDHDWPVLGPAISLSTLAWQKKRVVRKAA